MALLWNRIASLPRRLRSWRLTFVDEYPAPAGIFKDYPADPDGTTWRRVAPGLWFASRVSADGSSKGWAVQFDNRVMLAATGTVLVGAGCVGTAAWRRRQVDVDKVV